MNDMNKSPDKVKFDQEQSTHGLSNNVIAIPKTKKRKINPQRIQENAQVHVLPLLNTPRQIQALTGNTPIHLRVLLVEKNAGERYACRKALQQLSDFTVELAEAANGTEGLRLVSQQKFDCVLLGYPLPDMNGITFLAQLTDLMDGLHPPVLKLIAPGKPHLVAEAINGGEHDYLIKDSDGHYLQLLPILFQRMLERQCMTHEKHRIEAIYRTLIEHIPAITYITSQRNANRLLYVSPQIEQLGYLGDMWLSNPDFRFQCIYEEDRPAVRQAFQHSCNSGGEFRCEYRMLSRSGKLHWFLDEAKAIKGHDDQAIFFQGVMLDITEMKYMKNELHAHRYFLEQRVQDRTDQLEKRITILESCNAELCNQLDKERMTSHELRKIKARHDSMLCVAGEASVFVKSLLS